ncbi:McrC family protein [Pseudolactococcus hodotermopsidis]|nr:McrC family protein [Lactococcus hodotermopsidis]
MSCSNFVSQILRQAMVGFADDTDEIHGILIDVAWLWEAYLATTS